MITIKDVAEKAGVSIAAVSYALNGTGSVSFETKNVYWMLSKSWIMYLVRTRAD